MLTAGISVDVETDRKMHEILFDEFDKQTVVAILHRREHLHRFDRIVVMADGKIVSVGKHDEVVMDS